MTKPFMSEVSISAVVIVLLMLLLKPFGWWMPTAGEMMVVVSLLVAVAVFAVFMWRESARDEREALHHLTAGRIAYLAGATTLTAGIVVQSFQHALDPWLVAALGAMIIAKAAGTIYNQIRH